MCFSSRRRHTRLQGDWSSDVCSSDLWTMDQVVYWSESARRVAVRRPSSDSSAPQPRTYRLRAEIGRAAGRERGEGMDVTGARKENSGTTKFNARSTTFERLVIQSTAR